MSEQTKRMTPRMAGTAIFTLLLVVGLVSVAYPARLQASSMAPCCTECPYQDSACYGACESDYGPSGVNPNTGELTTCQSACDAINWNCLGWCIGDGWCATYEPGEVSCTVYHVYAGVWFDYVLCSGG